MFECCFSGSKGDYMVSCVKKKFWLGFFFLHPSFEYEVIEAAGLIKAFERTGVLI